MTTYKCRQTGDGPGNWKEIKEGNPWTPKEHEPKAAAETFAEEHGIKDMGIVEVFRHGMFKINVIVEYDYYATPFKFALKEIKKEEK